MTTERTVEITQEAVEQAALDWEPILTAYLDSITPGSAAGICNSGSQCALAAAFARHFGIADNGAFSDQQIRITNIALQVWTDALAVRPIEALLPDGARSFIRSFDRRAMYGAPVFERDTRLALASSKRNVARRQRARAGA